MRYLCERPVVAGGDESVVHGRVKAAIGLVPRGDGPLDDIERVGRQHDGAAGTVEL